MAVDISSKDLAVDYIPLARALAWDAYRKQSNPDVLTSFDEICGVAILALVEAERHYDASKGPFASFAGQRVRWALTNTVSKKRLYPVDLDAAYDLGTDTIGRTEFSLSAKEFIRSCAPVEQYLMHLLLDGLTLEQCAVRLNERFGCCRSSHKKRDGRPYTIMMVHRMRGHLRDKYKKYMRE